MAGRVRVLGGFAAFGAFWGAWGATLPAIQSHAGVDDGQLGIALLCIGAGALASMRPAGTLVDRWGAPALPATLAAFAGAAALPGLATSTASLCAALLVLGATSGAVDVAINAEGVRTEAATRPPRAEPRPRHLLGLRRGRQPRGRRACAPRAPAPEPCSSLVGAVVAAMAALAAARARRRRRRGRRRALRCAPSRACSSSSAGCARWPSSSRTRGRAGAPCTSSPTSAPPPPSARSPRPCSPAPPRSRAWAATRSPAA